MVLKFNKIYITDLSLKENHLEKLRKNNIDYLIFDHHESTSNFIDDNKITYNINKCGTRLFFEYLIKNKSRHKKIIKHFIDLVEVYDLWLTDHSLRKEAENLNRLLYKTMYYKGIQYEKYKTFVNLQLKKLRTFKEWGFTVYEKIKISEALLKEKRAIEKAKNSIKWRRDNKGKRFGIFIGNTSVSHVCHRFLNSIDSLDYIICINNFNNRFNKLSVRSKEYFDVRNLKNIEGHKNAGGSDGLDEDFVKKLWSGEIKYLGYKK